MPIPSFKDFAKKQYYKHMGWPQYSKSSTRQNFEYIFRDLGADKLVLDRVGNPFTVRAFSRKQALHYFFHDHPTYRNNSNISAIRISKPVILSVPSAKPRPIVPPKTVENTLGLQFNPEPRKYNDH